MIKTKDSHAKHKQDILKTHAISDKDDKLVLFTIHDDARNVTLGCSFNLKDIPKDEAIDPEMLKTTFQYAVDACLKARELYAKTNNKSPTSKAS